MNLDTVSVEKALARLSDDTFIGSTIEDVKLAFWLMRQPDVAITTKIVPLLITLYVLSPLDLIPDFIPILGQLDDVAFLALGVKLMLRLAPPHVIKRYEETKE